MSQQGGCVAKQTYSLLGGTLERFASRSRRAILPLQSALVKPPPGCCVQGWDAQFKSPGLTGAAPAKGHQDFEVTQACFRRKDWQSYGGLT